MVLTRKRVLPTAMLDSLSPLIAALRADGYSVIGPTLRDGAIVLAELTSASDLPHGWGVELDAGSYRVRRRDDDAAFGHSSGAQSWKTYLHPAKVPFWTAQKTSDGFTVDVPPPDGIRYAFVGVRPCDLRAIAIQGRVLGSSYAARLESAFIVAVDCTEPGEACFCVTAGGGPACGPGADIQLTETVGPRYLASAQTTIGQAVLDTLPQQPATPAEREQGATAVAQAAERMQRHLPSIDLRDLLSGSRNAARWDEVAQRCLACGNCTMVCPTCFCTSVRDTTDLGGDIAQRWQTWDSCFDLDFSYLHGGPVRTSTSSRYRQWLSHKLGTWHDQFGESGCVGCGRCIVWCPAGIDLTEEVSALAQERQTDHE
ncbi:4Fe-4S dicluster domain-containing protein [Catelliglobosispora koreensis]|uniref:4Fe-4S dicluster domain-containing protein n=1 Tax=Catelliglobosispora koreensis TaxID=129052 RepID=UPI00037442CF|nr:4Fe-4S dicluster domain-containing protein [Catelliglobosispora koreensis]